MSWREEEEKRTDWLTDWLDGHKTHDEAHSYGQVEISFNNGVVGEDQEGIVWAV